MKTFKIILPIYIAIALSCNWGSFVFGAGSFIMKKSHQQRRTNHGLSKHPLYRIYHDILRRCYNSNCNAYKWYGARGVTMCDEWKNDFKSFHDWAIKNGWEKGKEIDKDKIPMEIGVQSLLYSPDMCSVLTTKENMNAMSTNVFIEYMGKNQTMSQWAEEIGIDHRTIWMRIKRGMSIDNALSNKKTTTKETGILRRRLILNSESGIFYFGLKDASESVGMSENTLHYMMSGKRKNKTNFIYA